jgi:hypothetical protein
MQLLHITIEVASLIHFHGKVYAIQLDVLAYHMYLRRDSGCIQIHTTIKLIEEICDILLKWCYAQMILSKKSLRKPKGYSEAVHRRMLENTMAKSERKKREIMVHKTLRGKPRLFNMIPTKN